MDNNEKKLTLNEFVSGNTTEGPTEEESVSVVSQENSTKSIKIVSPENIAKTMQDKTGIVPEKEKRYDSYVDEIIETYGKQASDEVFEQAKYIVEQKFTEIEMNQSEEDIIDENHDFESSDDDIEDIDMSEDNIKSSANQLITDLSEEFDEESDEDESDPEKIDYDKKLEVVKSQLKEKIKPVTDKIDLASFTVRNKPISVFKAFENSTLGSNSSVSDWVLFDSGIKISMGEMKGYDIEKLNPRNSSRNDYNTFKDIYALIHDHIVNEDKPTLEQFLKLIKFTDIPNLYFSIYRSSFNKTNVLTYTCDKCNNMFVEDVNIDEMYKFQSPEIEKEFNEILSRDSVFEAKEYETKRIQISDEYVVELREPSIFNVIFETLAVDESFRRKYSDIMGILTYIESFYLIDKENHELIPIGLKIYENNLAKTIKYRILNYSKILANLPSDQFYILSSAIEKITSESNIKYVRPSRECPKCKHEIAEEEQSPEDMLFTRHQLGALVSM